MHFMAFFARNYYVIAHGILKSMFSQSGVEIGWNRVYWWCVYLITTLTGTNIEILILVDLDGYLEFICKIISEHSHTLPSLEITRWVCT